MIGATVSLTTAQAIVSAMAPNDVRRLRGILSVCMAPRTRQRLILRSGMPLGASMVAQTYDHMLPMIRRAN